MRCDDLRKRLPEYMDGALDAKTILEAEKHLFSCPQCRKELEGLKALGQKLSALKKVAAPDDFLEKVHGRIKETNEFNRMMRALFAPSRIKIPRVAIGAIATVIVGIALYKVVNITMPLVTVTEAPRYQNAILARKTAVSAKTYTMKPAAAKGIAKAAPAAQAQIATASLKQSVKSEYDGRAMMTDEVKSADYAYSKEALKREEAPAQEKAQKAAALSVAQETISTDNLTAGSSAPMPLPDLAPKVGKMVEGLGGKLIATEQAAGDKSLAGAGMSISMIVEIPDDKYDVFVKNLASMGKFEVLPEKPDNTPAGSMRLKIRPLTGR